MKPIRKRIEEARKEAELSWEIIEKDYILSWVLAGIAANKKLQNELVFKGGTALKKCYFGNYRFSEDLDFTAKKGIVREDLLKREIENRIMGSGLEI
jgi:predicted nucleotidyltransferase component of viral defense system